MAEEYQITIQVEKCQPPVKPKTPTSLYFSDKREAIVVQEDGYPYDRHHRRELRVI